jgi:beta-glucosidase
MTGTGASRRQVLAGAGAIVALMTAGGRAAAAAGASDPAIERLIAAMTLEEKAGQLAMEGAMSPHMGKSDFFAMNPDAPHISEGEAMAHYQAQLERVKAGQIGFLLGTVDASDVRDFQTAAVQGSRLKVPLLFGLDVIHGYRTIFPVPVGEAASWDPELARRTARAAAEEASAVGLDLTFAPMVDVAHDQRWGRVVEGAGEDPYLGSRFAEARVRGFQGTLGAADSVLACPKHFAAYGAAEAGLDYSGTFISERLLREVYLPPFQAAFQAGAITTMASFNTIDGVPSTGNHHLLTDILRGEWGFPGLVMSDYESEAQLVQHGFAADDADAARIALTAGCDVGMVSGIYPKYLPGLVRSGRVPQAALDEAVRRVLWVKKQAGLFDAPFRRIDARRAASRALDPEHHRLAREAGAKSIVLLKNDGEVLPLKRSGVKIALIGPCGDDRKNLNGPWTPPYSCGPATPLDEGLKRAMADPALLTVVRGSEFEAPIEGGIEAAVAAAKAADVVLLAIGETEEMSGESSSRTEIVVPAPQQALAEAVARTGKPVVVILRNGRALALEGAVRDAPAILVTWFLGSETGPAIADVLFGEVGPAGRLPMSFPRASGQEPYYYSHESSGRPPEPAHPLAKFTNHFIGVENRSLYPFGHGLTYSTIAYGPVSVSAPALPWNGVIEVSTEIRNTGTRAAEEVAQLYIHQHAASVAPPLRLLKGFQKIRLAPGESRRVSFRLNRADLEFVHADLQRRAEPGLFQVWISPSAEAGEPAAFTLQPA